MPILLKRRKFINSVDLAHFKRRLKNKQLAKFFRTGIARFVSETAQVTSSTSSLPSRTEAERCSTSKNRKEKSVSCTCKKNVCSEHSSMTVTRTQRENADIRDE